MRGLFSATVKGKPAVVEYEPDPDLRDTEQIPLLEDGGIEAFLQREVLPYFPDAWYVESSVKTGYEISFTRFFYKPKPLRPLEEIRADILALEKETEGLLGEIRLDRSWLIPSTPTPLTSPPVSIWLGDVPQHWEVRRLKEAATVIAVQSPPSEIVSA